LVVVDQATDQPVPCRVHLINQHGRPHKPRDRRLPFWHDHFAIPGRVTLNLPRGNYTFELERGPEYRTRFGRFTIKNFADDSKRVSLQRCVDMGAEGWYSGDLDVRRSTDQIEAVMRADDLHVAPVVTWHVPADDRNQGTVGTWPDGEPPFCFQPGWCWDPRAGLIERRAARLLVYGRSDPLVLSPAPSEGSPLPAALIEARQKGPMWVNVASAASWDMPMLVARGLVDSITVADGRIGRTDMGEPNAALENAITRPPDPRLYPTDRGWARYNQDVYFKLLDGGLRLPPTAGSASGASENPVGYNRVYVHVGTTFSMRDWWENLRAGHVTVTNGPLLRPTVDGHLPGHVFQIDGKRSFEIGLTLSTREPISYLEIIKDGRVAHSLPFEEYAGTGRLPPIEFDRPGWFLVRVVTDLPKTYRFAMTGPWYVEMDGRRRISRAAAQFFLDWVYERARQIELTGPRREKVIRYHRAARDFWQDLVDRANAE
jgi:hypothetical protein